MDLTTEQLSALIDVLHPDGRIHVDAVVTRLSLTPDEARSLASALLDAADFMDRTSW